MSPPGPAVRLFGALAFAAVLISALGGTAAAPTAGAAQATGAAQAARAAGEIILVTNARGGTLSVISRETHEVIKTIPAGRKPNRLGLAPDGRHVYIINDGSMYVREFDALKLRFKGRIRAGRDPYNMAFSPDGKFAYFVNSYSDNVTILDLRSKKIAGLIKHGGNNPVNIKISSDGRFAYVANELSEDVSVVDLKTKKTIRHIEAGHYIEGLDMSRDGKRRRYFGTSLTVKFG